MLVEAFEAKEKGELQQMEELRQRQQELWQREQQKPRQGEERQQEDLRGEGLQLRASP